jgi:hypothetical protein
VMMTIGPRFSYSTTAIAFSLKFLALLGSSGY